MKNTKVLSFLLSFLTCLSLSILSILQSYYFISLLIFIVLFVFYEKEIEKTKIERKEKLLILISTILAALLSFGKILSDNYYSISFSLFSIKTIIKILIGIIGFVPLLFYLINYLLCKLKNISINEDKKVSKKYWFIFSLIIFITWIPYYLINYPGIVSTDVLDQLSQILGISILNNHHPVLHTLYVGGLYKLFLFGGSNFAIACSVIIQMIILSIIFGYIVYYLNKKGIGKLYTIIIMVFYATPIFGIYATVLWKDSLFAGIIAILTISIIKLCDEDNIASYVLFIISSLLALLLRNNTIYMYIIFIPLSLIFFKEKWKKMIVCFVVIIGVYAIIKGPVFSHYNIKSGSSAESLAIPMQQIGRIVSKDKYINNKDEKLINEIINTNTLKKLYAPNTFDNIKFNKSFNIKPYDKNKSKYLKLWIKLVCKYPDVAVESYMLSTLGYWHIDNDKYMDYDKIDENNLGIYSKPKLPNFIINGVNLLKNRNIPILTYEYSCAFAIYLILFLCILCIYINNKKYLICYIPMFGLWLTFMIATPVSNEFRYVFWAYACLPILVFIPFKKEK